MIRRQIGLDRDARRRGVRLQDFADRARRHRRRRRRGRRAAAAWNSRGAATKCSCARRGMLAAAGFGQFGLRLRRHAAARSAAAPPACGIERRWRRLRRRRGAAARRAPCADRLRSSTRRSTTWPSVLCTVSSESWVRRSVSDWLKRMSDSSRLTMSTRPRRSAAAAAHTTAAAVGERGKVGVLAFEMAQDVLQPVLDPAEIAARADRSRPRGAPADRTRAVRDARRPRHCRCRPACGRCARTARGSRFRDVRCCRSAGAAARGFPASRSARRCAVRAWRRHRRGRRRGRAGRPWPTACARRRTAAPARRWRRRWRRWSEAPRSRLRADAPSRDRHWRAGSGRAWRRDCGSPRRSRRAARPASASAAPRGFRRARVRCRPAPGRRCRSARVSSMRRDSERISFSIDSIARRGIASVMAWRISASSLRKAAIDCSI